MMLKIPLLVLQMIRRTGVILKELIIKDLEKLVKIIHLEEEQKNIMKNSKERKLMNLLIDHKIQNLNIRCICYKELRINALQEEKEVSLD
jgi:hypothetical protein